MQLHTPEPHISTTRGSHQRSTHTEVPPLICPHSLRPTGLGTTASWAGRRAGGVLMTPWCQQNISPDSKRRPHPASSWRAARGGTAGPRRQGDIALGWPPARCNATSVVIDAAEAVNVGMAQGPGACDKRRCSGLSLLPLPTHQAGKGHCSALRPGHGLGHLVAFEGVTITLAYQAEVLSWNAGTLSQAVETNTESKGWMVLPCINTLSCSAHRHGTQQNASHVASFSETCRPICIRTLNGLVCSIPAFVCS
jgi:hypothetical protein